MIVSNAVTSERKDADYLFHPRQRKALNQLVSNLRQASFHWSGYTTEDVQITVDLAKRFLEAGEIPVTPQDKLLLQEATHVGDYVITNNLKKQIGTWHEMPMYVRNNWPADVRAAWSLDGGSENPTLMGASMLHTAQKHVGAQPQKEDQMDGLLEAGRAALKIALQAANTIPEPKVADKTSRSSKKTELLPALAGGVSVVVAGNKKKQQRDSSQIASPQQTKSETKSLRFAIDHTPAKLQVSDDTGDVLTTDQSPSKVKPKSAFKKAKGDNIGSVDPMSPLASTAIVSTSSAKLSYLMNQIVLHQDEEKILVFYESENVAYYIAQALECLQIKHLIYAKSLPSARKAQYVVTFNQTETFRVLIMDISQAAFGLDMSSASRVYFVNPVFSPQVEAQAVKRAHRIGQKKPVFAETLVLQGSIEEAILDRRTDLTNEEHNKCKNILDDERLYDWIRNVKFLPIPEAEQPGPEQMAELESPQLVFQRKPNAQLAKFQHPDADLISDCFYPESKGGTAVGSELAQHSSYNNETNTVLVPIAESPMNGIVSSRNNSASSPLTIAFNENESISFTMLDETESKDKEVVISEKAMGKRKADDADAARSSIFGNAVTPPTKKARNLDGAISPNGLTGNIYVPGDPNSTTASSFLSFQFEGERPGFFSNLAGHSRNLSAQKQFSSLSPLCSTSAGLVGQDDEIEFVASRKARHGAGSQSPPFRRQTIGLKVGDEFQMIPDTAISSTSSISETLLSALSICAPTQNDISSNKAQQARLNTDGTRSLVIKLRMGQNREKLKQLQNDSDEFRTDMANQGARIGPAGWTANIRRQHSSMNISDN